MTHVFHRHLRHTPKLAVAASGMTIRDAEGREYLDASGGAAVSSLGHGHPDVIAAMHAQIDKLPYAHTSFFTSEPAEQLADELIRTAPGGMSHVYLVSGGSEAVESALKMARQYFVEIGQQQRTHFIARRQSYHGNTLGALRLADFDEVLARHLERRLHRLRAAADQVHTAHWGTFAFGYGAIRLGNGPAA